MRAPATKIRQAKRLTLPGAATLLALAVSNPGWAAVSEEYDP